MSAALTILSRLDADDAPPPRTPEARAQSPRQSARSKTGRASEWQRTLASATGAGIIGLGLVLMPLPGPFGLPVVLLGLILLLKNSLAARRSFVRAASRHPRVIGPVRRLLRRRRAS